MAAGGATKRPWRISEITDREGFWIEGPEGSAATKEYPSDRMIVRTFPLSGEAVAEWVRQSLSRRSPEVGR